MGARSSKATALNNIRLPRANFDLDNTSNSLFILYALKQNLQKLKHHPNQFQMNKRKVHLAFDNQIFQLK